MKFILTTKKWRQTDLNIKKNRILPKTVAPQKRTQIRVSHVLRLPTSRLQCKKKKSLLTCLLIWNQKCIRAYGESLKPFRYVWKDPATLISWFVQGTIFICTKDEFHLVVQRYFWLGTTSSSGYHLRLSK